MIQTAKPANKRREAMATVTQSEKPFHVVIESDGALHSGHDNETMASAEANNCNSRAEKLGITTRYKVIPKP
jgi:hypothetical protein